MNVVSYSSRSRKLLNILSKRKASIKIALVYILMSSLWIFLSDNLLAFFIKDSVLHAKIAISKGIFFVFGSGYILYLLVENSLQALSQSKEDLRKKEEMYHLVIDGTTDGLWDYDIQSGFVYFSTSWKEKLGYTGDGEFHNFESWKSLLHPDDINYVMQSLINYMNKKEPKYNTEYRIRKKDGEYIWISSSAQCVWDEESKPVRLIGTHTDISNRKLTEERLNKTLEVNQKLLGEVIEYDKLKTEFFSNISHEFRTPLNVILGAVQLMEIYKKKMQNSSPDCDKIFKNVNSIKLNCYRLLRLINNLIDVTRIDSGYLKANFQNHNIVDIIEQVALSVSEFIENKSLTLIFDTDVEEKIMACDVDKIERIMLNLLSNAVKYSKPGGQILVNVTDEVKCVVVCVKDTGIGIPEEKVNLIFERFRQVNSSLTRENEGSGIGLSLVKSLVEMHGGEIWVESELNKGSAFYFRLPVKMLGENNTAVIGENSGTLRVDRVKVELSDIYQLNI